MNNENVKEDTGFPRIVGSVEYFQCVYNHKGAMDENESDNNPEKATPTKYCRVKKNLYELCTMEKAKKMASVLKGKIADIKSLHDDFPMLSESWDILRINNYVKLRRMFSCTGSEHTRR